MKKAVSAATSAALLASLLATAVAPSAFAAVTTASVGSVPRGGTSTNAATFTFSEETAGCVSAALGAGTATFSVALTEATPPAAVAGDVSFTGTPVVTAPGIMGATASLTAPIADTLLVKITGSDPINKQQITITGLKIKAKAAAHLGAITATLATVSGGAVAACFLGSTGHPTGTVAVAIGSGATSVQVTVPNGASCPFVGSGTISFGGANPETGVVVSAASAYTGTQTLTTAATANAHAVGDSVTASTTCPASTLPFVMTSPGTVADVVTQDVGPIPAGSGVIANVNPGEQNQAASNTWIMEDTAGFIVKNAVLTFTLSGTGVQFSASPAVGVFTNAGVADPTGATTGMTLGSTLCTISYDRTSCSVTVTAASTVVGGATVNLSNIMLDVASTVAKGTAVNVTVTGAGGVSVTNQTIAYVSRVIVGVAAQPTIYINYNDQPSGQMNLTEAGAGFFTDGSVTSPNNVFGLCTTTGETFTRAPWAVVTVGDLKLLSGLVGATSVQGTLFGGGACAYWTVYSASTVASTIEIRGSDASNVVLPTGPLSGPRYSVPGGLVPGTTQVNILVGSSATVLGGGGIVSKVSNAIRAFKSGVVVAALSQPTIPAGATGSLGGNVQISETLAGQFKPNEVICVEVQPRASNYYNQDTFFQMSNTNNLPVITPNTATSGLLVSSVTPGNGFTGTNSNTICRNYYNSNNNYNYSDTRAFFSFMITQQAFASTLGVITISNMQFMTTADAAAGPVVLRVVGLTSVPDGTTGTAVNGVAFESFVSNAKIGTAPSVKFAVGTALGATKNATFTTSTKVVKLSATNKYVTWRFSAPKALAGKVVVISVLTKLADGTWGAPKALTTRLIDINGNAYFWWKSTTATWVAVSATYAGDDNYAMSVSASPQARWMK